jgi:hypothetical protein
MPGCLAPGPPDPPPRPHAHRRGCPRPGDGAALFCDPEHDLSFSLVPVPGSGEGDAAGPGGVRANTSGTQLLQGSERQLHLRLNPATRATRRPAANPTASSSKAVLPTPGSPRSTSTPLCPARAPSSRPASAARSPRRSSSITRPPWSWQRGQRHCGPHATCPQLTALAAGRRGGVSDSAASAGLDRPGEPARSPRPCCASPPLGWASAQVLACSLQARPFLPGSWWLSTAAPSRWCRCGCSPAPA